MKMIRFYILQLICQSNEEVSLEWGINKKRRIFMSCLTHSKFPLLKRLSDGGWISCMFVNIICAPLHPRGTRQSLKVSDSNANICLAQEPEWESVGHLHQRYSLVDRSHKVEFWRWNNGRAERGLGMQIPHCTHPCLKQSILINISCDENLLIREKVETFLPSRRKPNPLFLPPLILCMWCHFLGDHLGKMETKHLATLGQKEPASLFSVWSSW